MSCYVEDLLEKYRGNTEIVKSIIKDKEELGMWERNPDYKDQILYHCWDASATIKDDTHATSTEVSTEGGISTQDARSMLSCSQLIGRPKSCFSSTYMFDFSSQPSYIS